MVKQTREIIKSSHPERISDKTDTKGRVHIYNGQKFLVKNSIHDDIFVEYFASNIAQTILGNRAPEVFFIKDENNPLKAASKFIDGYKSSEDYLSQYNNYTLPKECIVGCSLDINGEIQLTTNIKDPGHITKTFSAIIDHEQVMLAAHFTEHSDLHSLNFGIKVENGIPYAAVIDFDHSQMFNGKLTKNFDQIPYTLKPLGDRNHDNIYNLYFIYDRDKFAKAINEILQHKQEFIDIISDLEHTDIVVELKNLDPFGTTNIEIWLDNLTYKLAILEQEEKLFQLSHAFKNKDHELIHKLISEIDLNKIKSVSIQAIQEVVDQAPEALSIIYPKFWDNLQTHDYYKYAVINAAFKEDHYSHEVDIAHLPLNMSVLATAIKYNKIEVFNKQTLSKISSLQQVDKAELLNSAIVFDKQEIFNVIFEALTVDGKYDSSLWATARSAMAYGRSDYFINILNKLGEQIKLVDQVDHKSISENFSNLFNDTVDLKYAIELNSSLNALAPYQDYFQEALENSCNQLYSYKPAVEEALNLYCSDIAAANATDIDKEL